MLQCVTVANRQPFSWFCRRCSFRRRFFRSGSPAGEFSGRHHRGTILDSPGVPFVRRPVWRNGVNVESLPRGRGYAKLAAMLCPLCQQRHARRQCPALGRTICAVCCGSKRQVEIRCPPDCGYLVAAQAHPAASVRRRQEQDLAFVMAMRDGLTSDQSDLLLALLSFVAGLHADTIVKLQDEDAAEGAGALAATYETADRGLIYEHRPTSLAAQRFVTDTKTFLARLAAEAEAAIGQARRARLRRRAQASRSRRARGAEDRGRWAGDGARDHRPVHRGGAREPAAGRGSRSSRGRVAAAAPRQTVSGSGRGVARPATSGRSLL